MDERLFLEQLKALNNGESTKDYRVVITERANDRNKNEIFSVCIFRNREGMYKLQWTRDRKPELPALKEAVNNALREAFMNRNTFLTSGLGAQGMAKSEMVLEMIRVLGRNGILVEIN